MTYGQKPIMSADVERQINNAATQYLKRAQWKKWGLHTIRSAGAAILLKGPPGCGKTKIAEYLAIKVRKKGIKEISFADFGSHIPGENSRQIRRIFEDAKDNDGMTIFLDECEAVLWDRSLAGATAMWMLEVIDELLVQVAKYPYLTILATNKDELLDSALYRRLLAVIEIGRPAQPERVKLWKTKMPEAFPLKLSLEELDDIATLQLTGAEIENAIIDYASDCIRRDIKKPNFKGLMDVAVDTLAKRQNYEAKRIQQREEAKIRNSA
jgi:SpoVK/Ycf46/Vps4 family AAA+-type ATPase